MDIHNDFWFKHMHNKSELILWEWFDIYGIMNDFFQVMKNPVIVSVN